MENKNLIIGEKNFGNKKNLHGKKNKNTKFYSLYFYKVLTEEAFDEDSALKVVDIIDRIKERFNASVNNSTIQDYINEFKVSMKDEYKLCGNAYKGYYTENLNGDLFIPSDYRLDDTELNVLIQQLRTSKMISVGAKKEIIEKLSIQGSYELQKFVDKNSKMLPVENLNFLKSLFTEDMIEIINEKRPMLITLKKGSSTFTKEFHLYTFIPYRDTYYLIGKYDGHNFASYIQMPYIDNYTVIEDRCFEKYPIKVSPALAIINPDIQKYFENDKSNMFILPSKYEMDSYKNQVKQKLSQIKKERHNKEDR